VVFGEEQPIVSSTKGVTRHLLGGAGVVEAAATVLALARGQLPPTRNLDEPDSKCDLNHLRGNAVAKSVEIAMSNSFAFGGHNVSPVFGPHPQAADAGPGIASRRSAVTPVDTRLPAGDTIAQRQTHKEQITVEPASRQLLLNG
jgi:acyl transferase domain-containing protein